MVKGGNSVDNFQCQLHSKQVGYIIFHPSPELNTHQIVYFMAKFINIKKKQAGLSINIGNL